MEKNADLDLITIQKLFIPSFYPIKKSSSVLTSILIGVKLFCKMTCVEKTGHQKQ